MSKIPGTRVEDNALHRASLWLMAFQDTQDGDVRGESLQDAVDESGRLATECGVHEMTGLELEEGVTFYGENMAQMMFGSVSIAVMTPAGMADGATVMRSVWRDGLRHGMALAAGKRGLSNDEISGQ